MMLNSMGYVMHVVNNTIKNVSPKWDLHFYYSENYQTY